MIKYLILVSHKKKSTTPPPPEICIETIPTKHTPKTGKGGGGFVNLICCKFEFWNKLD